MALQARLLGQLHRGAASDVEVTVGRHRFVRVFRREVEWRGNACCVFQIHACKSHVAFSCSDHLIRVSDDYRAECTKTIISQFSALVLLTVALRVELVGQVVFIHLKIFSFNYIIINININAALLFIISNILAIQFC